MERNFMNMNREISLRGSILKAMVFPAATVYIGTGCARCSSEVHGCVNTSNVLVGDIVSGICSDFWMCVVSSCCEGWTC